MATTDSKGILFYEETDAVSPLHTLLNTGQQSVSNALPITHAPTGKSGAMPIGTNPITKTARVAATTTAGGLMGVTFPVAFPNGISSVVFTTASGTAVSGVLNGDAVSVTGFTAVWPGVASTAIVFYYIAIGW